LGQYVDINHGNGYVTRYGHNQRALVVAGQVVARGQPIATLGSSGRATGPHLHFEVLRDGRPVDPLGYLGR
jgi:murein DD-endopeptidase MepM/ murein hydrolase activator NlpD